MNGDLCHLSMTEIMLVLNAERAGKPYVIRPNPSVLLLVVPEASPVFLERGSRSNLIRADGQQAFRVSDAVRRTKVGGARTRGHQA